MTRRSKGQSTAEYAIVLGLVLAAFAAMQVYAKRGVQARVKGVTDEMTQASANKIDSNDTLSQYEPYYASTDYTGITQTRNSTENFNVTGTVDRTGILEKTTRNSGSSTTGTDTNYKKGW